MSMVVDARTCSKCGETKTRAEFGKGSRNRNGKLYPPSWCKRCNADLARARRESNPEAARSADRARYAANPEPARRYAREASRRKLYGITPDDYDAMLAAQGSACAICRTTDPGRRTFHVDHDHQTGRVRGLLCRGCNTGLGLFGDSLENLRQAIAYLQKEE